MNTYRTQFTVVDPLSGHPVRYTFQVKTPPQVVVAWADMVGICLILAKKPRSAEEIADFLRARFPGKHTLTTTHFGVLLKLQRVGTA